MCIGVGPCVFVHTTRRSGGGGGERGLKRGLEYGGGFLCICMCLFFPCSSGPFCCVWFSGRLVCRVTAANKSESAQASLKVVNKLTALLSPPTITVTSGSDVNLTCTRMAGYEVEWRAVLYRINSNNAVLQGQSSSRCFLEFLCLKINERKKENWLKWVSFFRLFICFCPCYTVSLIFLVCIIFGMHIKDEKPEDG